MIILKIILEKIIQLKELQIEILLNTLLMFSFFF